MRAQRRNINRNVLLNNRLSDLTNPHNRVGDIHIVRNETVGGTLDVKGDIHADNYYLKDYVLIPAGTIVQSAANNQPAGWYDCDGRTLTIELHQDLFNAIGYTFGGADLSFNLPDMRGKGSVGTISPANTVVTVTNNTNNTDTLVSATTLQPLRYLIKY
jgi:hypothetical protein